MKRTLKSIARTRQPQVVIIKRPFVFPQQRCDKCVEPSGMITPDEAAVLFNVSTRAVYRWLETEAVHFSEVSGGMLLVCFNSLAATAVRSDLQAEPAC